MIKMQRKWPDNWRRGPNLGSRVKTERWGRRAVLGAAALSLAYVVALQFIDGLSPAQPSAPNPLEIVAAAAPSVSTARAAVAGPEEQKLWDQAVLSRTRQSIETYQKAYPSGLYAAKAQEALSSCRQQTRERWQSGVVSPVQAARGEAPMLEGVEQSQACANARAAARQSANQSCASNAAAAPPGATFRYSAIIKGEASCACAPSADGTTLCVTELQTSCSSEQRVTRTVEVCGG